MSFVMADQRALINFFDDDAYYYFKIASNITETGRSTFDLTTKTNGYHPLWMLILLPIFTVWRDPVDVLRVIGIFSLGVTGITGYLSLRYLSQYSLLSFSLASSLMIWCIISFGVTGMEVTVLLPLLMLAFLLLKKISKQDSDGIDLKEFVNLGVVLSFVELARLDAVFLVLTISFFLFFFTPGTVQLRLKKLVALGIFPLIVMGGYLLINYLNFRHFVPTSGESKSLGGNTAWINTRFVHQLITVNNPVDGTLWVVFAGVLGISVLYLVFTVFRTVAQHQNMLQKADLVPLTAATFFVIFTAYQLFLSSWVVWRWYAYPLLPMVVFFTPQLINQIEKRLQRNKTFRDFLKYLSLFLASILFLRTLFLSITFGNWAQTGVDSFKYENYLVAEELNKDLNASEPYIAVGDKAGSFGYFFNGKVLQLEGLVSDYELLEALKNDQLMAYMSERKVQYVMSSEDFSSPYSKIKLLIPSPSLSAGPYAAIELCEHSEYRQLQMEYTTYYIWKWPSCGLENE